MKSIYALGTALAIMAAAMPAFAQDSKVSPTPLTGPYIGVYGGYDWTDTDTAFDPSGWDGGVFAGYKFDALMGFTKNIGIGANSAIEAFYGVSNADDSAGGVTMEKDNEWGVSFRPGLSFLDAVTGDVGLNPYAILGYRNTEFNTTTVGENRFHGFELGIGTEVVAFGNAGLRLEYAHVWYGSEAGVNPDSDDVRLGLSYHF